MKSIAIDAKSNGGYNRAYSSTLNRPSTHNNNMKTNFSLNLTRNTNSTDDFNCSQMSNKATHASNNVSYTPMSEHNNYNAKVQIDLDRENTRRSRTHDQTDKRYLYSRKDPVKRDLSVPPTNSSGQQKVDEIFCSKYSFGLSKYSIGDLDASNEINDFGSTDLYDSVINSDCITPPPVQMIHEYANKKAIIRPLAFRPVQSDLSLTSNDTSPSTPQGFVITSKVSQMRRSSPPPIPPHASRLPRKSSIGRVQSLKSGDSSGYYSGRTVCTATGNTQSSDISPTLDVNGSLVDSATATTGDIYANTMDLIHDYHNQIKEPLEQPYIGQSYLDTEIITNKEHCKFLETALSKSNAKLLNAETQISELKMRLCQKTAEANETKESLTMVRRNLENQSHKAYNLEKSIQSIQSQQLERNKERATREKTTQVNLSNSDYGTAKLMEQFDEERRTWLDEKLKVLTYQKQIEINFQKLLIKYRHLENQLLQMKTHMKETRSQHSYSANPIEDHDKSSLNSTDSSGRNFLTNISRIESTEHQASF